MDLFQEISAARKILELPERATMPEIKANYKKLLNRWHPDKCSDDIELCNEMTGKITAAYKTIVDYCNRYSYSFSAEEVANYLSEDELWMEQFGNEPLWGKPYKPE
ncbi:MAG: J domain-containing protein [Thermoleophilia bacterium]